MLNVLLLEDRGSITATLTDLLEYKGFKVYEAFNPSDANSYMSGEEEVEIHAIILDLNLPTDGLKPKEINGTKDGLFSGWIWFKKHVLPSYPEMLERTIIYSAYLDVLKMNATTKDKNLLNQMKQIKKREGNTSPGEEIIKFLQRI